MPYIPDENDLPVHKYMAPKDMFYNDLDGAHLNVL